MEAIQSLRGIRRPAGRGQQSAAQAPPKRSISTVLEPGSVCSSLFAGVCSTVLSDAMNR